MKMKDIKKLWDKILNAEKQSSQQSQFIAKEPESQQPEKTEAMQKLVQTAKDFTSNIKPEINQLNDDISSSSSELSQIKELVPDEYETFIDIYRRTRNTFEKISRFSKYLENYQIYRKVQEFLATTKTGQYKFFDELDIYLTADRAFDTKTALDIIDFSKERYDYEFNENPIKLLAEIKYQEDSKIQSEISSLKTSISLPSFLIDELQSNYDFDINREEDITKLTHVLIQRIKDRIPQALRPDVVNDLLNAEPIIISQISSSIKISTITQASSDMILQIIRGFDKKVEQLTKERNELSKDIDRKHEDLSELEKQATALRTKINGLERTKMELEDKVKELKTQSDRAEVSSSLYSGEQIEDKIVYEQPIDKIGTDVIKPEEEPEENESDEENDDTDIDDADKTENE